MTATGEERRAPPAARATQPTAAEPAGDRRVVARSTAWALLQQVLPTAVTIFFTPYVLHHLGVVRYGLFVLTASLVSLLATFDGGVRATSQRYFGIYAGQGDRWRTTRLLVTLGLVIGAGGCVLSAVGWVVAFPLVDLLHVPGAYRAESGYLFRTLGILLTFGFLHNLFVGILQAHQRYSFIAKAGFATYAIWVGGLVVTIQGGWGLRGVAVVFVGQQVFLLVSIVPASLRYTARADVGLLPRAELREFLRFGRQVQVSSLSILVNDKLDALVVGAVRSARVVALYNAGTNFAENAGALTINAIGPAQTSLTNTMGSDGEFAAFTLYRRYQHVWSVAIGGWFVVAGSCAWFGVTAWLGPQFRLGGTVAVIALGGTGLYSLSALLRTWCSVIGKPGIESRAGIVSVLVNLVLTVPLAYLGGAIGVICATAAGQVAGAAYLLLLARRQVSLHVPSFVRLVPLGASAAAAVVTVGLELALRPVEPSGGLGLIVAGLPAIPGLATYAVVALGRSDATAAAAAVWRRLRGQPLVLPPLRRLDPQPL